MRFAWLGIVGMLGAACSGGDEATTDAALDGRLGCGDCDAPWGPDADPPDAPPTCAALVYTSRPVESIVLFDGASRLNAARSFRVQIGYDATPCDRLAMPTVQLGVIDHTARIDANVFTSRTPCPGLPVRRTRVVTLRLDAGTWRIIGAGAPTPPSLEVTIDNPPGTPCGAAGECRQDCDCGAGAVCLTGTGIGGPFNACGFPCELDRDCGDHRGRCDSVADGLAQVCNNAFNECGDPGQDCPDGFACNAGFCEPTFVLSATTRHECTCDADCDAPLRCIESDIDGRAARCEMPCPTAGPWCTGLHVCGPASQDVSGLAPSDSVCGFLGE